MTDDTHPAAIPTGSSFAPKPRRKAAYRTYRKCSSVAPCGSDCILNANASHVYHTCRDARCEQCHGERFRFGGQR